MTYEEDPKNWARLSPKFRDAHNKLRVLKGLPPIPPPKKDLWVKPRGPKVKPYDFSNTEFQAAARQFMGGGGGLMGVGEPEFTINGRPAKL